MTNIVDFLTSLLQNEIKWVFIIFIIWVAAIFILEPFIGKEAVNKRNGEKYENNIVKYIKDFLAAEAFHHLLFTKDDDSTSETDMAFVNRKGIFCVECKYTSLYAKPKIALSMDYWQMPTYDLKNPFNQNESHIRVMSKHIKNNPAFAGKNIDFFNIVCVAFDYTFIHFVTEYDSSKNPYVPMLGDKKALITTSSKKLAQKAFTSFKNDMDALPDIFTDEEVKIIQKILSEHVATKEQLERHVMDQRLREYYKQNGGL